MLFYSYAAQDCIHVSETQYMFLDTLSATGGNISLAREKCKVTDAAWNEWVNDPLFWPCALALARVIARARGLTPEYLKDFTMATMKTGSKINNVQMQAANLAAKMLGVGVANNKGRVSIRPDEITVDFGEEAISLSSQPKSSPTGLPGAKNEALDAIGHDQFADVEAQIDGSMDDKQ